MKAGILIVDVGEHELDAAARIHSASWQESHRAFCTPEFVAQHTPQRQKAYLRGELEKKRLFMLVDEAPVGIVSVCGSLIENLYVLPDRQGLGYGTTLLEYAMAHCSGTATLWILDNNEGAQRLYERHGFRLTGKRNWITPTLSELEMQLGSEKGGQSEC